MALAAQAITISGQLRAVDAASITIRRPGKVATLAVHVRSRLRRAKAGDTVRVTAKPDSSGYWAVAKLEILRRATVPRVKITSGPSGTVHAGEATFGYAYAGPVIWAACSLDGSAWFACRNPAKMPTLGPGMHRFAVLAMNGRHHTIVTRDWTIANDVPPVAPPTVPANVSVPVISGTAQSRKRITATAGTWDGSPTGFSYQWQRCTSGAASSCSDIGGATSASYTCQTADIDLYLRVSVTAINSAGQATALSAATPKTLPS